MFNPTQHELDLAEFPLLIKNFFLSFFFAKSKCLILIFNDAHVKCIYLDVIFRNVVLYKILSLGCKIQKLKVPS